MKTTDLSKFNNDWYQPGSKVKKLLWYFVNVLVLKNHFWPHSASKVAILRAFGAKIGKGVVLKPGVSIKYPWLLSIGNHSWIGENVWIDNLGFVSIGDHVCISQGALLLCGNHNYASSSFDLMIGEIHLEEGVWIGAKCTISGGVRAKSHAVLSIQSVASKDLDAYSIYRGNPATKIKERTIKA